MHGWVSMPAGVERIGRSRFDFGGGARVHCRSAAEVPGPRASGATASFRPVSCFRSRGSTWSARVRSISGHGPTNTDGSLAAPLGKVGRDVSEEQAYEAARLTALAILGSLKRELGDLDRIAGWVRVFGMVNSAPGFNQAARRHQRIHGSHHRRVRPREGRARTQRRRAGRASVQHSGRSRSRGPARGSGRLRRPRPKMSSVYDLVFPAMWISWAAYWWLASRGAKPTSARSPWRRGSCTCCRCCCPSGCSRRTRVPTAFLNARLFPWAPWPFWLGRARHARGNCCSRSGRAFTSAATGAASSRSSASTS